MTPVQYDPAKGETENVIDAVEQIGRRLCPGMKPVERQSSRMRSLFAVLQAIDAAIDVKQTTRKTPSKKTT